MVPLPTALAASVRRVSLGRRARDERVAAMLVREAGPRAVGLRRTGAVSADQKVGGAGPDGTQTRLGGPLVDQGASLMTRQRVVPRHLGPSG
jgi:hypothetical protein